MSLVPLVQGCSSGEDVGFEAKRQAFESASDVLGFESVSDWSSQGSLSVADYIHSGNGALKATTNGYAEIVSVPLSQLGPFGETASLQFAGDASPAWGEVRLILQAPSIGEYWRDLGGAPVAGLSSGQYHTLDFYIPQDLRLALESSDYTDLTFRIVINAPAGSYSLDSLLVGAGGAPGGSGAPATWNFEIVLPGAVSPLDATVSASDQLKLSDRVSVLDGGSPAGIYCASGNANLGVDTIVGGIVAGGNASLQNRAVVEGDVLAGGSIVLQADAQVLGTQSPGTSIPTQRFAWSTIAPPTGESVRLEPDDKRVLMPGAYSDLVLKSRSKIYLESAGEYFFRSVSIEPDAELVLRSDDGVYYLYVDESFVNRGGIASNGGQNPHLLLAYSGTTPVLLERAFKGTVVAPNAEIRLQPAPEDGHEGAFFGKTLVVEPETLINHRAFPWAGLIEDALDLPDGPAIRLDDSPVLLISTEGAPDSRTTESPITFEIPDYLPVSGGNAGDYTSTLSYQGPGGAEVVCTYRGAATTSTPNTLLENARGKTIKFESCSNGLVAGDRTLGEEFVLDVHGVPDHVWGTLSVTLALGDVPGEDGVRTCGGTLEPPILPEDSREMVDSFDWAQTSPLAETDLDGNPALYYANIYVRNPREKAILDLLLVHYDTMPILRSEMEQYFGRCGTVDMSGDGAGIFVFAFIPGGTYNLIRERALDESVDWRRRVIFDAIILRDMPAELIHPGAGTIKYANLMDSGFYYRDRANPPPEEVWGFSPFPGWLDKAWDDVKDVASDAFGGASDLATDIGETFVSIARGFGRGAMMLLGGADRFIYGSIDLSFDLRIFNVDHAFRVGTLDDPGDQMIPGWSAKYDDDDALELKGVRVEINQWAVRPLSGVYPMKFNSNTSSNGYATLTVSRDNENFIGGDVGPFQNSGICVFWKNDTAEITQSFFPDKQCDWRVNPVLRFKKENDGEMHPLETWDRVGHALNQMTEARDFLVHAGHTPRRASVLRGHAAAIVTSAQDGERRLFAPCLGFSSLSMEVYQDLGAAIAPAVAFADCLDQSVEAVVNVGFEGNADITTGNDCEEGRAILQALGAPYYMGLFSNSDILMPDRLRSIDSRGVMVHEYGHYSVCSILSQNPGNIDGSGGIFVDSLTALYAEYISNPEGTTAHTFESLADMFAARVVGGVNYFPPFDAQNTYVSSVDGMSYCNQVGGCLEGNHDGESQPPVGGQEDFDLRIGRLTTLYLDAFDGWRDNQFQFFKHGGGPLNCAALADSGHDLCLSTDDHCQVVFNSPVGGGALSCADVCGGAGMQCLGAFENSPSSCGPISRNMRSCASSDTSGYCTCGRLGTGTTQLDLVSGPNFVTPKTDPFVEVVELPDEDIVSFIAGWGNRKDGQGLDAEEAAMESLGERMAEDYDWCQVCEVFALHEPGVVQLDPQTGQENTHQIWEECRDGEISRYIPGSPPDPDLRMGHSIARECYVCPEHHISNEYGVCEECPLGYGVVGNECQACPPGQVVHASGECGPCGFNEIAVASEVCVECPPTRGPNSQATECVDCPMDAVVNWSEVSLCGFSQDGTQDVILELTTPGADDVCPDRFWVEVNEIDDMDADLPTHGAYVRVQTDLAGDACTYSDRGIITLVQGVGVPQEDSSSGESLACFYPDFELITSERIANGPTSRKFGVYFRGKETLPSGEVSIVNDYSGAVCVVH